MSSSSTSLINLTWMGMVRYPTKISNSQLAVRSTQLKVFTSDKIYLRPLRSVHVNMRNAGKQLQAITTTASFT